MPREEWCPVLNYEGVYEVSNRGRVRRVGRARGSTAGRIITLKGIKSRKYLQVDLSVKNRKRRHSIHSLVAEAFIGKRPSKRHVVNHKNGIKHDNRPENLEWCTHRQNILHAHRSGLMPSPNTKGIRNGRSKLSEEQVRLIRKLKGKLSQDNLSVLCGVARSLIQRIHQGKAWSHV